MRNELPRTQGQDHDISRAGGAAIAAALLLGALCAALPSGAVTAQGAVPCTAIDEDDERLACYDRALRGTAPPAPAAAPARAAPPPAAAPAPTNEQAREPREPRERRIRESEAPAAPAAPAAGERERDDEEEIVPVVIVGTRSLPGRETTFTANDGTTWVQTDSQRIFGLPDPPFDAELKRGVMGSYFLVPTDRARAIRVRPVNR